MCLMNIILIVKVKYLYKVFDYSANLMIYVKSRERGIIKIYNKYICYFKYNIK